ncbi:uncharacterized protein EV422DRAFT_527396 [Fimicolochytrium jonesii]|uniref:uncharacterized protein n=1 Tax=Fimicolochytrium jonesii TaxID=1396493 RepID=UPI0022FE25A1|nr:uncharacterized protein EV422DRAFT_527396 [Fimicolochytrium jonesii]KAI8821885.1 hypothetical protein EV422DRAFT_527396 [Fimicolochytrium jonesii]
MTIQPVTPIPRTSTTALLSAFIKSACWDERTSMSFANPSATIITTPSFTYHYQKGAKFTHIFIYDHIGAEEDMQGDLAGILEGLGKGVKVWVDGGVASPHATPSILEQAGFTKREFTHTDVARLLEMVDTHGTTIAPTSIPPPEGVTIHEITSSTDPRFAARCDIESDVFVYIPTHASHLPAALAEMTDRYGDYHLLATAGEETVAYMTLRVHRGVAYLQGSGVAEAWRKKGITKALLARTVTKAVELGFEVMLTAGCDDDAVGAWTAMGFKEVYTYSTWEIQL